MSAKRRYVIADALILRPRAPIVIFRATHFAKVYYVG